MITVFVRVRVRFLHIKHGRFFFHNIIIVARSSSGHRSIVTTCIRTSNAHGECSDTLTYFTCSKCIFCGYKQTYAHACLYVYSMAETYEHELTFVRLHILATAYAYVSKSVLYNYVPQAYLRQPRATVRIVAGGTLTVVPRTFYTIA